jgi:protein-tyrosine phosphatase
MNSEASAASEPLPTQQPDTFPRNLRKLGVTLVKKVVPRRFIQEIRRYRAFKKSERPAYLKLRIAHELGFCSRKVPQAARSIVFICFGNIMRSPISEALFRRALAATPGLDVKVVSAGLNATPGKPAHPWAVAAAQELGISLADHKATLLTAQMVEQADAVIAMDLQNKLDFLARYAQAADKFYLLGTYGSSTGRFLEIRDPFFGDLNETRACYKLIEACTKNLAHSLIGHAGRYGTGSE